MFEQLGLIGCGLMGGSFALALRRAGLVRRVVGYSQSATTLQQALQLGVIDEAATSAELATAGADLVLIAVPVAATEEALRGIRNSVHPEMLIMDVGSTKRDVVDAARRALAHRIGNFVPAHPIAGKETAGVASADVNLYAGRKVILTPLQETRPALVQQAEAVWAALGCRVTQMTAEQHDSALACVSHLPHLLGFAMMNAVAAQPAGSQYLALAGPGFRDFTRIAASDPAVWRDIMMANADELLAQSRIFRHQLQTLEALVASGDAVALERLIAQASLTRTQWGTGNTSTP